MQANDGNYFVLERNKEEIQAAQQKVEDYDYEEPYFEPASEEEDLLQQLQKMAIPFIEEHKELEWVE